MQAQWNRKWNSNSNSVCVCVMCVFAVRFFFFVHFFRPLPHQVSNDERLSIAWHIMNNQFWTTLNAFSFLAENRAKLKWFHRIAFAIRLFSTVFGFGWFGSFYAFLCLLNIFGLFYSCFFFVCFLLARQRNAFFYLFYLLNTFRKATETWTKKVEKLIPSRKTLLLWRQCSVNYVRF